MLLPFLLIFSLIAEFIELDMSVPSLPDIAKYFNVSSGRIQLTVSYNFWGLCIGSLLLGPLSECYGRRKIMIIGNTLLLIGAVNCVFAPSVCWLLVSRFIQGVGASTSVVIFAIAVDLYRDDRAVKFFGIMNATVTIVFAIAPILGSIINETIGWRGNYMVVAIICFISWLLSLFVLPETKNNLEAFSINGIIQSYKGLLLSKQFTALSLLVSFFSSTYMVFVTCAPFLYMKTYNLSNITYALHQCIIVGSFSLASLFSGKITQKLGEKWCVVSGTGIAFAGSLLLVAVSIKLAYSFHLITLSMVILIIGSAICQPVIGNISMNIFPDIRGIASSAIAFIRSLVPAMFIGFISYIYNGHIVYISLVIVLIMVLANVCLYTLINDFS